MKINKKNKFETPKTHGGGIASRITPLEELKRSVFACLLWEDNFYEDGDTITNRIKKLIPKCNPRDVIQIAKDAKFEHNLRHIPLFIMRELARNKDISLNYNFKQHLADVIQRADELTEFLSIYWKDQNDNEKDSLSNQVKKALAVAFKKFDEYQLAKYNRNNSIKLRDVLRLVHPKPDNKDQELLWKKLLNDELKIPDTWEVSLSSGADKKETFERLITEGKLGGLAFLRNLRNMVQSNVDKDIIKKGFKERKGFSKILPYRYLTASYHAPEYEPLIEESFLYSLNNSNKLDGKTIIVVDVSGSMYYKNITERSDINRAKAACCLATILREVCIEPVIYATAGNDILKRHYTQLVPARKGFALIDSIYNLCKPLGGGGIFLRQVIDYISNEEKSNAERIIVITDEQDCSGNNDSPDKVIPFGKKNYILNVNTYENGIAYNKHWTHINGFSESVVKYIIEAENSNIQLNK